MWRDEVMANQMMPFGLNMNVMNRYPNESMHKPPFNSGIVLNPGSLNYSQSYVPYVNVNNEPAMFGCNPSSNVHMDDMASNEHPNEDIVNC